MLNISNSNQNSNSNSNLNQIHLLSIRRTCDNSHKHCREICQIAIKSITQISQQYFSDFLTLIGSSRYSCCLSSHYNPKHNELKKFITLNSEKLKITNWETIISYMSDDEIYRLILNQEVIEPNFISKLIGIEILLLNGYGVKTNLLNHLITGQTKIKSFSYLLMSMSLDEFNKYLDKITKTFNSYIDDIIVEYIEKNKDSFTLGTYNLLGIKIIYAFVSKPTILKTIYPLVSKSINVETKQTIFNKIISTLDKSLLILILENKDFVANISTIDKLVEKSYPRPEGSTNSKSIADIVDILCEYGLKIDKPIVLKLLSHGCYVNNLEKYGIKIDNEILSACADLSYYPYKFDIIPNSDILKKECSKHDNINTIRKLKEFGGIYTPECLEIACRVNKNGRVIKYLIEDCGVKITDKCLEDFQQAYKIDALDYIMKKYKTQEPIKKTNVDKEKSIEINEKSIMTISPRNIKIDIKDNITEYRLKNKIRKFFECKKKTIKYNELYEMFLKYLISNKLIIGKYFVINIELSNLLKISHCVIMDTNQIFNILTYFIDLTKKSEIITNTNIDII